MTGLSFHIEGKPFPIKIVIIALCIIFFILMILYSFNLDNSCRTKIEEKITLSKGSLDTPLNKLHIKSAYNCCCVGNIKYDYVNLCALDNCYNSGARCLDFQIFSLNQEPIISSSSSKNFEYKELFNHLSFTETMKYVKKKFLLNLKNLNDRMPLFLNFRIFTNDGSVIDKMHKYLTDIFDDMIYINNKINRQNLFSNKTLNELKHKVIIMVDFNSTPENIKDIENSKLYDIITVRFGKDNSISSKNNELEKIILESSLSAVYPLDNSNSVNYNTTNSFNYNYSFIFMNMQVYDVHLKNYLKKFKNRSFINKYNNL